MSEECNRYKAIRAGHRGALTRLAKEIDEVMTVGMMSEEHYHKLNILRHQLEAKDKTLTELDRDIMKCCELSEIEKEVQDADVIAAKVIECKTKLESVKRPATTTEPVRSTVKSPGATSTVTRPRLPKLTLPTFKGDVTHWTSFWDSYDSAIHNNTQLSTIDKFNYLNSLLEGPAARSIKGLTLTEGNYDSAIDLLKERFGKKQKIIDAHADELMKIPTCPINKPHMLRSVYDQINVHIRGLAALKIKSDECGFMLVPVIMSKLPSDVKLRIARESTEEVWKVDDLMNSIKREVEAREACDGVRAKPQVKPNASHASHAPTAGTFVTHGPSIQCAYCQGHHYSASCNKIKDVKARKDILLKNGRCFNCLKANHKLKDCRSPKTCRNCHQRHHQSICTSGLSANAEPFVPQSKPKEPATAEDNEDTQGSYYLSNSTDAQQFRGGVLLQTAQATALDVTSKRQAPVRVLFDCGSQRSYVTENLCSKLELSPIRSERLHLNTFGDAHHKTRNCKSYKLCLSKPGSLDKTEILVLSFPVICANLAPLVNIAQFSHLMGLELADNSANARGAIDVLVGSDFYWSFVGSEVRQSDCGPVAISSKLGWLLSGPLSSTQYHNIVSTNLIVAHGDDVTTSDELVDTLKRFWEVEAIGITDVPVDQQSGDKFLDHITFTGERYEVNLPWKEGNLNFSDDYLLSLNRLRSLHRRLLKEPQILKEYDRILQEQLSKGIIEKVEEPQLKPNTKQEGMIHYLPHHGVLRQQSSTTKLRIVYDGSAKSTKDECSLNDCLQVGPNFIPKLFNILIKFRSHPIAITADIEKAFLMVGVASADQDVLRFLWLNDPSNPKSSVTQFRFTRLVFGLRSSPAILGAVISHHLQSYKTLHPSVKEQIEDCLYVDDLITGTGTVEQGVELYQRAKGIMKEAGLNLRKWNSNSSALLTKIAEMESVSNTTSARTVVEPQQESVSEEEESYSKCRAGLLHPTCEGEHSKLLGVAWNSHTDQLLFKFDELIDYASSLPPTKRSILKITAKIFDPLGLLGPFVIRLKLMFRRLCMEKVDWDEVLEKELVKQWKVILAELETLSGVKVDRCYFIANATPTKIQLHGVCDASVEAYAAVLYVRTVYSDDSVSVSMLASKTRVCPLKAQTIPRLELLAAVILSRLFTTIRDCLSLPLETFLWTDSMVVLCWLQSNRPCKQYVSSRVSEIRRLTNTEHWYHCPGALNPADLPSRGMKGTELLSNTFWWEGPEFLKMAEREWPCSNAIDVIDASEDAQAEFVKDPPEMAFTLVTSGGVNGLLQISNVIDCSRFSSLRRLLTVTVYVLRFIKHC